MTKSQIPAIIDPSKIKWKFFYRDSSGKIIHSEEKPANLPTTAILNTSIWFWGKSLYKNPFEISTPRKMEQVIERVLMRDLGEDKKANLCLAVPCEDFASMCEYYGYNPSQLPEGVKPEYVILRMHNDLRNGSPDFLLPGGLGIAGSMPAKEGAQQIASAIENGFDIWSCAGGNTAIPKFQLCEKYFAAKGIDSLPQKKSRFIGFSDASSSQFYLHGLIEPVHYLGLMKATVPTENAQDRSTTNQILKALEGDKIAAITQRKFISNDIAEIQKRASDATTISNLAFFPRQLRTACDTMVTKLREGEKLILSLEGYSQVSAGHNVSEVLF